MQITINNHEERFRIPPGSRHKTNHCLGFMDFYHGQRSTESQRLFIYNSLLTKMNRHGSSLIRVLGGILQKCKGLTDTCLSGHLFVVLIKDKPVPRTLLVSETSFTHGQTPDPLQPRRTVPKNGGQNGSSVVSPVSMETCLIFELFPDNRSKYLSYANN